MVLVFEICEYIQKTFYLLIHLKHIFHFSAAVSSVSLIFWNNMKIVSWLLPMTETVFSLYKFMWENWRWDWHTMRASHVNCMLHQRYSIQSDIKPTRKPGSNVTRRTGSIQVKSKAHIYTCFQWTSYTFSMFTITSLCKFIASLWFWFKFKYLNAS